MTNETLAAEWRERLDDFSHSGLGVEGWCAAHDLPSHRFYYWRSKLSKSTPMPDSDHVDWLSLPICPAPQRESTLTVRIGAASIDIAPGFDPALLRAISLALGAAR